MPILPNVAVSAICGGIGLVGAICVSQAVPAEIEGPSTAGAEVGQPRGPGNGRVVGVPVGGPGRTPSRGPSGPLLTTAVVSALPGEVLDKNVSSAPPRSRQPEVCPCWPAGAPDDRRAPDAPARCAGRLWGSLRRWSGSREVSGVSSVSTSSVGSSGSQKRAALERELQERAEREGGAKSPVGAMCSGAGSWTPSCLKA